MADLLYPTHEINGSGMIDNRLSCITRIIENVALRNTRADSSLAVEARFWYYDKEANHPEDEGGWTIEPELFIKSQEGYKSDIVFLSKDSKCEGGFFSTRISTDKLFKVDLEVFYSGPSSAEAITNEIKSAIERNFDDSMAYLCLIHPENFPGISETLLNWDY